MLKTLIAEGKTTAEAINNGLKELNVSKEMVNIKVLEDHEKRSFFSILAPRVVKVELTVKENKKSYEKENLTEKTVEIVSLEDFNLAKEQVKKFLNTFINEVGNLDFNITENTEKRIIYVDINGDNSKILIGYRGEVLNAFQNILNSVVNRNLKGKIKLILNISNYREKREKSLDELAEKVSKTVLKTGKSITLEPMTAYERKIIHSKLQSNDKVETHSVGEEPYRRVVISKK